MKGIISNLLEKPAIEKLVGDVKDGNKDKGFVTGIDDFIGKPLKISQLKKALEKAFSFKLVFDFEVIAFSIFVGMLVWVSDAILDHLFFSEKSFLDLLIIDVPDHKLFIRILIVLYFFLFGGIIAAYANKHKKSTEELQDYKFRYKTIADKINAWEFWKNIAGGYNYVSPAFERITGYLVDDFKQNPELIKKIIHPDDLERVTRHLEDEATNTMEIAELEFKIVTQNNEVKKIKHTCQPVYDKNGNFKGTRGSNIEIPEQTIEHLIDITEFRQLKNDLNTSEELFKALFENAPDAFYLHDLKGIFVTGNNAAEKLTGYKREELIGKNFLKLKLLSISDAEKAALLLAENALGNPAGPEEFTINRKDGKKVPVEIRSFPVKTNGRAVVFGVARDISERKTAEKNLTLLNQAIETSREIIFMTNVEGIFTYVNPEFTKMYGYTFEEVVGIESPRILKSGTISKEDHEKFWEAILKKESFSATYANKSKDGKLVDVESSVDPILDDNGDVTGFLAIQRDITEHKKAAEELNEKTYELEERVKELNCLYDISHQMANAGSTVENIILKTIQSIPPSWKYPEITCARINLNDGRVFSSPNWKETTSLQTAEIVSGIGNLGSIDVGYLEEKPEEDEGPFLKEERNLIDAIGILLGDFIEKKEAESTLIESENKFRTMTQTAQDAVIMMDENGNITYWNKAAEKMFGFSEDEIMGKNLHRIIAPHKYFEKFKQGFKQFQISGEGKGIGKPIELFALNKRGEEFPIELSISAVNLKGKWNSIGIVRDITQRKLAEEKLKRSEDSFRGLYENSTLGIYRSTPEGKIIMANPAALKLLGYASFEELSNIKVEDGYYDSSERKRFKEIIDSEGTVQGFEIKWKKADGSVVDIRENARTLTDTVGKVIYYEGIFEDISEKKRAEKLLIKAKEKAEEMNLLKSNFLANMSHELRTPLAGILGYAEIIQSEITDDDQKEMINAIIASGKRLTNTLNSILDISKVEAEKNEIKLTPMEIAPIVTNTVEVFKSEAENKNVVLKTSVVNINVVSPVDERLLKQVISNLVGNALKYTEKGSVEIVVESSENIKESVIKVIDTGIGIRPEDQKVIFKEFRQASEGLGRHFEGAGLGLTITKKFVELMNGKISLESELGKGSVFTVTFPSAIAAPGNKEIAPEEPGLAPIDEQKVEIEVTGLPRILLVDDDPNMRNAIKRILKTICLLDTAVNGAESISMAGKNNYDIILMDINLGPGINGLKAASTIRKVAGYQNTPIVALTAYAMAGDKERFLTEGCTHYLSKPFGRNELIYTINKILRRNGTSQVNDTGIGKTKY